MVRSLEITSGALAPPLVDQVNQQGFSVPNIQHFQQDADAILRLSIRGYIPRGVVERCRSRLVKRLLAACQKT